MVKTVNCKECRQDFDYEPMLIEFDGVDKEVFARIVCPPCAEESQRARVAAEAKAKQEKRDREWHLICPGEMEDTEVRRLPNHSLHSAVMSWRYGPRGLMVCGKSGKGKSRCAWLVVRREFLAGKHVRAVNAYDLSAYPFRLHANPSGAQEWLDRAITTDLLLLDDAFKAKLSERAEEALFFMVDERTSRKKPILMTCNDSVGSLLSRLSEDRGQPIIRRLREFCEVIEV